MWITSKCSHSRIALTLRANPSDRVTRAHEPWYETRTILTAFVVSA